MIIKSGFNALLSIAAISLTASSLCKLIYFISHIYSPSELASHRRIYNEKGGINEPSVQETVWAILVNISLIGIFILQHLGMAKLSIKEKIRKLGLKVEERSLYIIFTSLALLLLMHFWHQITWITLWHVNTQEHILFGWLFTLAHSGAWFLILADTCLSDCFEFLGLKQTYCVIMGRQDLLNPKSAELCRLYSHMRHSGFICFCILFWFQPVMSIDKLLLAIFLTTYMASEWQVDSQDLIYAENRYHATKITVELNRK